MAKKVGEIVFDDKGNVIEVNGYDGDRKSFEFVELSEYYEKLNRALDSIYMAEDHLNDVIKELKGLI